VFVVYAKGGTTRRERKREGKKRTREEVMTERVKTPARKRSDKALFSVADCYRIYLQWGKKNFLGEGRSAF